MANNITCEKCGATDLFWKRVTKYSETRFVLFEKSSVGGQPFAHDCAYWQARHAPINIIRNVRADGQISVCSTHGETFDQIVSRVLCQTETQAAEEIAKLQAQYPTARVIDRIVEQTS